MTGTVAPPSTSQHEGGRLRRLPMPSLRLQRRLAAANVVCQVGIATTGAMVRVTKSGLGCNTWPRCNSDSFVPVPGAAPMIHQAIEFGNRTLTFVLTIVAVALLLAVLRAGRRRELVVLAVLMPAGILAQAVIGGITVLAGLLWWTVAIHLIPTMALAWFSAVLWARIGEPDDAPRREYVPRPLRRLIGLSAVVLVAVLVTGTMVTGAGPHAGDARVGANDRLQLSIVWLVHFHAEAMVAYLCLVIGLLVALVTIRARGPVIGRARLLIGVIALQGVVGITQYWLHVPAGLVVVHVTLAAATTAVTGALWAACVRRTERDDTGGPVDAGRSAGSVPAPVS